MPAWVGLVLLVVAAAAETHYETLEVPAAASVIQIKRSYYKLAKTLHPDRVDDSSRAAAAERFKLVGKAYAVLSDADQRRAYDQELMLERRMRKAQQSQRGSPSQRPVQSRQTSPSPKPEKPSPPGGQRTQRQQQEQQQAQQVEPVRPPTHEGSIPRPSAIPRPSPEDADPHALARKRLHEVHSVGELLELTDASDDGKINVRQARPLQQNPHGLLWVVLIPHVCPWTCRSSSGGGALLVVDGWCLCSSKCGEEGR